MSRDIGIDSRTFVRFPKTGTLWLPFGSSGGNFALIDRAKIVNRSRTAPVTMTPMLGLSTDGIAWIAVDIRTWFNKHRSCHDAASPRH